MTISSDAKIQKSQPKNENAPHSNHQKTSQAARHTNGKQRKLFSHTTTVIIAFIALISSIYSMVITFRQHQNTSFHSEQLLNQIHALKQQQIDTKAQIDNTIQSISKSDNKLRNQLNTLNKNLQSALQQRLYQTKDWLLLKARYYLELAQINSNWSDNFQTTAALLKEADALLAETHDQRTMVVRQAITKEITELQAIPKLDIAGLLSRLDAAQNVVMNLPLKSTLVQMQDSQPRMTKNKSNSAWKEHVKDSLSLIEKFVVIRRNNEDVLPLPSPAYESVIRETIRLNLQDAQWAVLKNNEGIYQFSLTQAIKNVNGSFAADAPATKTIIQQLQSLQQIHLIQQQPMIEQSLLLLNQFIESKDTLMPIPAAGENS